MTTIQKNEEQLKKLLQPIAEHIERHFGHEALIQSGMMLLGVRNDLLTELNKREAEAAENAVFKIMSSITEGLFDNGDLFIKRKPIEDVIIGLIGYEKYKAIQTAVDSRLYPKSKTMVSSCHQATYYLYQNPLNSTSSKEGYACSECNQPCGLKAQLNAKEYNFEKFTNKGKYTS